MTSASGAMDPRLVEVAHACFDFARVGDAVYDAEPDHVAHCDVGAERAGAPVVVGAGEHGSERDLVL